MRTFNTNTSLCICINHLKYKYRPYIHYAWCNVLNNKNYCLTVEENIKRNYFYSFKENYIMTI